MGAHMQLVKHRLPTSWDGWMVRWGAFEQVPAVFICPSPKQDRCECGSASGRLIARGSRQPKAGETTDSTKAKMGRFGRLVHIPVTVPAWPVYDLIALRCPDCRQDEVWDMRTDEWWTLGPEDYGVDGSVRPIERQWSGGLFDLLDDEEVTTT